MRRGIVIALVGLGVLVVILAVALASVGSRFDEVEIERDDLEFEVGQLEQDVAALTGERDTLKRQAEEQLKTIEQLKAELERTRSGQAGSEGIPQAPSPAPASP
jgi:peptidoglycan hydrolase CwlO-like protein